MNTKFTPAPWEYRDVSGADKQIYGVIPFKANCVEFTLKADSQPLYEMLAYETWIQFEPKDWTEMQEANGHLIAAAPDLYEALEKIINFINISGPRHEEWKSITEWCEKGSIALTKARGEL